MKNSIAAGLLAAGVATQAPAAPEVPPPSCETMATTVEMVECASWELDVADRWLNQIYAILRDERDDQGKALLRDAQRAWIAMRDATCAYEADEMRGGTMASVVDIACRTQLTRERARLLGAPLEGSDPPRFIADDGGRQIGAFACDGQITEARLGLSPREGALPVEVQLMVGTGFLTWPIDPTRQDAVCEPDVSLSLAVNPEDPECPALVVQDTACDGILVYWNGTEFVTQRN